MLYSPLSGVKIQVFSRAGPVLKGGFDVEVFEEIEPDQFFRRITIQQVDGNIQSSLLV